MLSTYHPPSEMNGFFNFVWLAGLTNAKNAAKTVKVFMYPFLIFSLMALIKVDTIRNSKISENYGENNQADFDLNPALTVWKCQKKERVFLKSATFWMKIKSVHEISVKYISSQIK